MQSDLIKNTSSSVLIISPKPELAKLFDFDVDIFPPTFSSQTIIDSRYEVIVFELDILRDKKILQLFRTYRIQRPSVEYIGIRTSSADNELQLLDWHQDLFFSKIVHQASELPTLVIECLERSQESRQEASLHKMVAEQSQKLKELQIELEERVIRRQHFLEETVRKNAIATARWRGLKDVLIQVYQARSIGEIEANLIQLLKESLNLISLRIFFAPQDQNFAHQFKSSLSFAVFQAPILRLQQVIGSIFFIRDPGSPFLREDTDFMLQISDSVSLAIDRLSQLQQTENLREQWQATFNAILDPVLIINDQYDVIQTNSITASAGDSQKKCYQVLFGTESPCPNCSLNSNFKIERNGKVYDVSSEKIEGQLFVNLYHDISDQTRMERKILETARLAELGTIGSSIAHELNNPLGGILSFVQLMKLEHAQSRELMEDLNELEGGVRRCQSIIENLLGFTRNPDSDFVQDLDLKDAIDRALKILELKTRNEGIEVKPHYSGGTYPLRGHLNLLAQGIQSVLQIAIESMLDRQMRGQIEIRILTSMTEYKIEILDNAPAQRRRSSLQYTMAAQLFHDQGYVLEVSTVNPGLTCTMITVPRSP